MKDSIVFLLISITLCVAMERHVLFQTVVYPSEMAPVNDMRAVYDDFGLVASLTVFDDGSIITRGNAENIIAASEDLVPRVMYIGKIDENALDEFVNFISDDGFLTLPDHHKTEEKYGLICDTYSNHPIEHEVCRTKDAKHEIIDAIEQEIENLIYSAQDTFITYVPDSIYVKKLAIDSETCSTTEYSTDSNIQKKYGMNYDEERFFHFENVRPFWNAANSRLCINSDGDTFGFVVTSRFISINYDYKNRDPGFDPEENGRDSERPFPGDDDCEFDCEGQGELPYNPTFVIIAICLLVFIFVLSAAVRARRNKRQVNTEVQMVDATELHDNYLATQPAFYVTQTTNGPIYYQTNPNPTPNPGLVYTVHQ